MFRTSSPPSSSSLSTSCSIVVDWQVRYSLVFFFVGTRILLTEDGAVAACDSRDCDTAEMPAFRRVGGDLEPLMLDRSPPHAQFSRALMDVARSHSPPPFYRTICKGVFARSRSLRSPPTNVPVGWCGSQISRTRISSLFNSGRSLSPFCRSSLSYLKSNTVLF